MGTSTDLVGDPWIQGCAVVGVLMLTTSAIVGLPWQLWLGWAYVAGLSAYDVTRRLDR